MPEDFINPERLHVAPYHRRTVWGDMRTFTAGIKHDGVLVPLICRKTKHGDARVIEVVCGMRRLRASLDSKLTRVPYVIRELTDAEAIEIQAKENLGREDLHPLDEADYYQDLLDGGYDLKMLSRKFQRQPAAIRARLLLRKLSTQARAAYAKGVLTDYGADKLARLPTAQQQNAVLAAAKAGALTDADLVNHIRRHLLLPLADVPWELTDAGFPGGPCNVCPKRTGANLDLFGEIAGGDADLCTDAKCWRGKMDHAFSAAVEAGKPLGHIVDDRNPNELFIARMGQRPAPIRAIGLIDVEDDCPLVPGETWADAAALASIQTTVRIARDQDGRPRLLIEERAVATKIRRLRGSEETPIAKAEAAGDPARAEARAAKAAAAAREQTTLLAILRATDHSPAAVIALARASVSPASTRAVAKACGVEMDKLAELDDADTFSVVLALLASELGSDAPEVQALVTTTESISAADDSAQ